MVDKKEADAALELFSENDYWKAFHDKAPSVNCRERIEMMFYFSAFLAGNADEKREAEYVRQRDEIESRLSLEDWKYLLSYAGNNPWKKKCRDNVERLSSA